ncbi:MAG: hypothetical protein ABR573_12070 [Candidatus Dormibacteria bacterium]
MIATRLLDGYSRLQSLPDIHVPVLGNRWTVGLFFLLHVSFGSFTMGTIVLSPTYQLIARRRDDARFSRYARGLGEVNIRIFSIGATLAGFAVLFVTALYPRFFIPLVERFWWQFLVAFTVWIPAIAALYLYVHQWNRWAAARPRLHLSLGYYAAAFEHIFLILVVGIDSYLLTPDHGFLNASFLPELGHRFVGNISWASFFIAGISAVRASWAGDGEKRAYLAWATRLSLVVGFLTMVVQAILGFVFAEAIKQSSPGAFTYSFSGRVAWLWIVQGILLSVLIVGSNLYFAQTRPSGAGRGLSVVVVGLCLIAVAPAALYPRGTYGVRYVVLGTALLLSVAHFLSWRRTAPQPSPHVPRATMTVVALSALCLFLLMGIIRTTARGSFTVYGKQTESQSYGLYQPSQGHYP